MRHVLNLAAGDFHVHGRDKRTGIMAAVVPLTASQFAIALYMANTDPLLETPEIARAYRKDLDSIALRQKKLVAGYLTEKTRPEDIERGFKNGDWDLMKGMPKGASTRSHAGIRNWRNCWPAFAIMEAIGMPLALHGEINVDHFGDEVDPFEREERFVNEVLGEIWTAFPKLKISLEHISTEVAARTIKKYGSQRFVGTATPQHILRNRTHWLANGPANEGFCYPIPKHWREQEAVFDLVTSGCPWISAGSDSAPHPTTTKESQCGCAGGVMSAHAVIELYTMAFEQANALHHLENFLCRNAFRFYDIEPIPGRVVIEKKEWTADSLIAVEGGAPIHPFGYHPNPDMRMKFTWKVTEVQY